MLSPLITLAPFFDIQDENGPEPMALCLSDDSAYVIDIENQIVLPLDLGSFLKRQ